MYSAAFMSRTVVTPASSVFRAASWPSTMLTAGARPPPGAGP